MLCSRTGGSLQCVPADGHDESFIVNDATPRLDSHAVWSEGSLWPKLEMYPMSGIMWSHGWQRRFLLHEHLAICVDLVV